MREIDFREALQQRRAFIDVRAPIEFQQGAIPGAQLISLLDDQQRAEIGTCYKQQGPTAAIELAQMLISGPVREQRLQAWEEALEQHPQAVIYCYRGGLRSQSVAREIQKKFARDIWILRGGYKAARRHLIETLKQAAQRHRFVVVAGKTGSGKTEVLCRVPASIDLEGLANHRGSAFGTRGGPQPSQADFDNRLAKQLFDLEEQRASFIALEDESRLVGRLALPESIYQVLRSAPLILLEESLEARVNRIVHTYLCRDFGIENENTAMASAEAVGASIARSLAGISPRLGGARSKTCLALIEKALESQMRHGDIRGHHTWVEYLLVEYYDVLYQRHIESQAERIVFSGSQSEVASHLLATCRIDSTTVTLSR